MRNGDKLHGRAAEAEIRVGNLLERLDYVTHRQSSTSIHSKPGTRTLVFKPDLHGSPSIYSSLHRTAVGLKAR